MTISANLALAYPEIILAVGAMVLLVFGAFAPKQTKLVGAGGVLVLLAAAVASATPPFGIAFPLLRFRRWLNMSKTLI